MALQKTSKTLGKIAILVKMLWPLRQKRHFSMFFQHVFKMPCFQQWKTRKHRLFWQNSLKQYPTKAILPSFLTVFYRLCFFELFDEIWRKMYFVSDCFCWFFQGRVPKRFLKKSKNSRFFACCFLAVELRVVLASTTKEWAELVGEYLGRGSLLLEDFMLS